jgi:hypothetical protein
MAWVSQFHAEHGRKPRVLGIGNVANNAFKNAVALRTHGIECDVMCNDYYHAMSSPEWECARFSLSDIDINAPDWAHCDLKGYERPRWFAQGYHATCIDYLVARCNNTHKVAALWEQLAKEGSNGGANIVYRRPPEPLSRFETKLEAIRIGEIYKLFAGESFNVHEFHSVYQSIIIDIERFKQLFRCYDVVIGYATSGLYPLLAAVGPYLAYEHGTIRTLPFEGSLAGNICALVYKAANNVLITNCDNIVAAKKMKLREFRFVPHAILEDWRYEYKDNSLRTELLCDGKFDFVAFHPSRQHWSSQKNIAMEKGNDIFIRGFASFVRSQRPRARLILIDWGESVAKTLELIVDCGIENNVYWLRPMPIRNMSAYIVASDVLADQFLIGAWGAIMPIGLMLGKPTMSYVNEELHRWCFPKMPPVLNAKNENEVLEGLRTITDVGKAANISRASLQWYNDYHSMSVVAGRLIDAIRSSLESASACSAELGELNLPLYWLGRSMSNSWQKSTERFLKRAAGRILSWGVREG